MLKIFRSCLCFGFIFVWASVFLIPLGIHLQTKSPGFEEFEQRVYADLVAANAGQEQGGPSVYFLIFWWPFVACWCVFVGLLFTFGVWIIRQLSFWNRDLCLLAAGAFGLGCTGGAVMGLGEAIRNFQWGFAPLGFAYLISSIGLAFGAAGTIGMLLCKSDRDPSRAATNQLREYCT